jgi:excisionase family DNA binding protein
VDSEVRLLSRVEAAKALGVGKANVSDLINEGRIGFIFIGKRIFIPFKEIQNFIDTNTTRVIINKHNKTSEDENLSSAQFLDSLIKNN